MDDNTIYNKDTGIIYNKDTGVVNWEKVDKPIIHEETEKVNPVDKNLDDLEKQLGIKIDKEKVLNISRESLLDFVESQNSNHELTEEEINQMVDNILSAVQLPEVIEKKDEINEELGLSPEDLKSLYRYLSGKSNVKPQFLDRYLAGSTNKLIDFQHVMTLIRLSQIPQLAAMNASIQQRLYSPENLINMDAKDLATASANINREMSDILSAANKSIEIMNSLGRIDNRYQSLIDKLLVVPDDVLAQIEHLLNNYQ